MTRFRIWLDDLGLQDIDPSIHIIDVQEHAPQQALTTAARASGDGLHVLHQSRESLTVAVRFAIREQRPTRRSAILQRIKLWAQQGGSLAVGHRPGLRLMVAPGQLSNFSSLRWTEALTLTFTAYHVPYWEDVHPTQATASPALLFLPGDAPAAPMDLRWRTSLSGQLALTITTPLSSITFRDMQVGADQELFLSHDAGVLTATLDGVDIRPHRTPESSDDLLLPCGQSSNVTVTANGEAVQGCTLIARGRWL